jgi:hypothetical protein
MTLVHLRTSAIAPLRVEARAVIVKVAPVVALPVRRAADINSETRSLKVNSLCHSGLVPAPAIVPLLEHVIFACHTLCEIRSPPLVIPENSIRPGFARRGRIRASSDAMFAIIYLLGTFIADLSSRGAGLKSRTSFSAIS